jgi:DNA invertase Pin-like site-specific DNA recombinase
MIHHDVTSWTGTAPDQWVAFYVRVTKEESVKQDLSIPNQIARCHEIAVQRRWPHYKIYVEPRHVSGELWTEKRPKLKEILEDVAHRRVPKMCARHVDRYCRGAELLSRLRDAIRPFSVELWDFSTQHDYKSAHGFFSLTVLCAAGKLEVDLDGERIREMKRGKAKAGKSGGGPPPYGYTSQSRRILELRAAGHSDEEAYRQACLAFPVGRCWYIDEKEAETVRLIFHLYLSPEFRYGCKRIVQYLNQRGFRTQHGYG